MKNKIQIGTALAALMLLAACSNEEETLLQKEGTPVVFTLGGNILTKTTTTESNGDYTTAFAANDEIGIFATGITASNVQYKVDAAGNTLTAVGDPIKFTDATTEVSFTAYYPYATLTDGATTIEVAVKNDQSLETNFNASDFMTATAKGTGTNAAVELNFKHKLAMVQLELTGEAATEVKLCNVITKGTYTIATDNLETAASGTADIAMYNPTTGVYWALVPAQTIANGTRLFTFKLGGSYYTVTANENITLNANEVKKFSVFNSTSLSASITVEKWGVNSTTGTVAKDDAAYTKMYLIGSAEGAATFEYVLLSEIKAYPLNDNITTSSTWYSSINNSFTKTTIDLDNSCAKITLGEDFTTVNNVTQSPNEWSKNLLIYRLPAGEIAKSITKKFKLTVNAQVKTSGDLKDSNNKVTGNAQLRIGAMRLDKTTGSPSYYKFFKGIGYQALDTKETAKDLSVTIDFNFISLNNASTFTTDATSADWDDVVIILAPNKPTVTDTEWTINSVLLEEVIQ